MKQSTFSHRLQLTAASNTTRFTEIVRLSGLIPEHDFRNADLSGTDLRGEYLRDFDFSNACFKGAMVQGAVLNHTVKKRHLEDAKTDSRAVVTLLGEGLGRSIVGIREFLGHQVIIPDHLTHAARQVEADRERRRSRTGIHFGDNSDLARRRLATPFRLHERTIVSSRSAIILFEPTSEVDFDILDVARSKFYRAGNPALILLLPNKMGDSGTAQAIMRARLSQIPSEDFLDIDVGSRGFRGGFDQRSSQIERSRDRAMGFLSAVSRSEMLTSPKTTGYYSMDQGYSPWILDGSRKGRRGLYSAIEADLSKAEGFDRRSSRRHVLIRRDLYERAPAEQMIRSIAPNHGYCALSVFSPIRGSEIEYYVASGPVDGPLWKFMMG